MIELFGELFGLANILEMYLIRCTQNDLLILEIVPVFFFFLFNFALRIKSLSRDRDTARIEKNTFEIEKKGNKKHFYNNQNCFQNQNKAKTRSCWLLFKQSQ